MRLRLLIITIFGIAVTVAPVPVQALTVSTAHFSGPAEGQNCSGLINVSCTLNFGTALTCVETASDTAVRLCNIYGQANYSAVGSTAACVGEGTGNGYVFSPVSHWNWIPFVFDVVMSAGVAEINGSAGFLGRSIHIQAQVALAGGCAGSTGAFTGTFEVVEL